MQTIKALNLTIGIPILGGVIIHLSIGGIYALTAPLAGISEAEYQAFLNYWFLTDLRPW